MSIGKIFFLCAAIVLFLGGIGVVFPQPVLWGLFLIALGLLLEGVPLKR